MGVLSLSRGFTRPRWSMVARLPLKMPPMPPRTVSTGGNRASIQGLAENCGVKIDMRPPAKRLMRLKLRARMV